jgi:hypothetical protein
MLHDDTVTTQPAMAIVFPAGGLVMPLASERYDQRVPRSRLRWQRFLAIASAP